MIDDPDAKTEAWEDDVFANSQAEAESRCEQMAESMTRNGGSVVRSLGARQISGKLYKCKFVSEVPNADN
jgi:hypothetical protein